MIKCQYSGRWIFGTIITIIRGVYVLAICLAKFKLLFVVNAHLGVLSYFGTADQNFFTSKSQRVINWIQATTFKYFLVVDRMLGLNPDPLWYISLTIMHGSILRKWNYTRLISPNFFNRSQINSRGFGFIKTRDLGSNFGTRVKLTTWKKTMSNRQICFWH